MNNRIQFLDGLRGVAIILVVLFHAYSRWPLHVPYGYDYNGFFLVKEGWLGVYLFFIISGFVILLTLEKCNSVKQFLYRRWIRLFPAMLVATILVFLTAEFFSERPRGEVTLIDTLPGLTFIDPKWWSWLLGMPVEHIEFAFWSLYVEMKFYVLAAIIYFWKGRNVLIITLVVSYLFTLAITLNNFGLDKQTHNHLLTITQALSFRYFGWFAMGAMFYVSYTSKNRDWFIGALILSIVCSAFVLDLRYAMLPAVTGIFVTIIFALPLINQTAQRVLSNKGLLFLGWISYPFYLIHENALISITAKLGKADLGIPLVILPLIATSMLIVVATLLAKYIEPWAKRIIDYPHQRARRRPG